MQCEIANTVNSIPLAHSSNRIKRTVVVGCLVSFVLRMSYHTLAYTADMTTKYKNVKIYAQSNARSPVSFHSNQRIKFKFINETSSSS